MDAIKILDELIGLSHNVGREDRGWAILGEGNTSAAVGDGSFWVKASGSCLSNIDAQGFSRVALDKVLALVDREAMTDAEIKQGLQDVLVDPAGRRPSVETFLHALCLTEGGAKWVGHTHTESVLKILCSTAGAALFQQHIYPDEIVVCGRNVVVVPYVDPGLQLARTIRHQLRLFNKDHGCHPKLVLMINHGPVALGQTSSEVLNILWTADKWARVLIGAQALGGVNFLTEQQADRIENRPDEHLRRQMIAQGG